MSDITTRSGKGSPLTNNEVDANFTNLNTDKLESGDLSVVIAPVGSASLAYNSGVFTYTPPDLTAIDLSLYATLAGATFTGPVIAPTFEGSLDGNQLFKAKAGEAITKGHPVYISGISGNTPIVMEADADDPTKMPAFGLASATVAINAAVNVVTYGQIHGLDTTPYALGAPMYVSTTPGGLSATAPTGESSLIQNMGKVERVHDTVGTIFVAGAGRSNATPNLNNGNFFLGNASNQSVSADFSAEVATQLAGTVVLGDVSTTGSVEIDGDLTVNGTTVTINATELALEDNMIYLNEGSAVLNPDLGIAGGYNDGTYAHAGIFRDASDGVWKIYDGYTLEPDASAYIDITHASFTLSDMQVNTLYADGGNSTNWNTAYGWGDHSLAGYLTSYVDTNTTYTAGTGLSLDGTVFSNSAPDQTVTLTGGGATAVTGTYPDFTVTSTDTDTVYTHPTSHSIGFITGLQTALDGKVDDTQVLTNVPAGAVFTDTVYTHPTSHSISFITGLQTALDGKVDDSQVLTDVPAGAVFTDTVYTLPFTDNSGQWNTAYGWGDHAGNYLPLSGGTVTGATTFTDSIDVAYSVGNTFNLLCNNTGFQTLNIASNNLDAGVDKYIYIGKNTGSNAGNSTFIELGDDASGSLVKAFGNFQATGTVTATGGNSTNWNTAYGWGDHASAGYLPLAGGTLTGSIALSQNPVGTTYGDGVTATPTDMISQPVGDNDGWRLYGESPASNDVKVIFEVVDDIETGDTWVFRNKKTYTPWTATEPFKITGEGNITALGTVTATGGNSTNWNTAYGWGNHASAGYTSNVGDITGVTAGTGLIGGGTSGAVTLNVIGGTGITANANDIAVDSTVIRQGQTYALGNVTRFQSNDVLDTSSGGQAALEIFQDTNGADAFMAFHVNGDYAAYFGLHGGINDFVIGGWSKGAGYQRVFHDGYHPLADKWTTARTLTLNGDVTGSVSWDGSANATLTTAVGNDSHSHSNYTPLDNIRSLGVQAFTNGTDPNITTAQILTEIDFDGGFDSHSSVFKTSWSYAGNYNLTDAGRFTETAGTSWLTWTDNSSDTTRGYITALAIAPNSGGSAGKMFVYNDQGPSYSPGWREIWTSTSDGPGSGLDADLLDGQHGSYYAPASHGHSYLPLTGGTLTGGLTGTTATFASQLIVRGAGNSSKGNIHMGAAGNGTNKWTYLTGAHYNADTESEGIALIGSNASDGVNDIFIGGSIYESNPATSIKFWTHTASTHNTGGSHQATIDGSGNFNLVRGNHQIGSTTVIDSSRNIFANQYYYANGKIVAQATDNYLRINQSNQFGSGIWIGNSNLLAGTNKYIATGGNGGTTSSRVYMYGGTYNGSNVIALDGTDGKIKGSYYAVGGTTVIDSSRNLTNIGTINGGDLILGGNGQTPKIRLEYVDNANGPVWDTTIHMGRTEDLPSGSTAPTSTANGGYGVQFQANSDGCFYGIEQYSSGNYRPLINWGDDVGDSPFRIAFNNATRFQLYSNGNFTANGNVTAYSDIRLKDDIQNIENALEKVLSIRGVTYKRNDLGLDAPRQSGVIAQEVEKVLPEVVYHDEENDVKTVAYGNMVGLLIESIKELKAEVDDLKAQLGAK